MHHIVRKRLIGSILRHLKEHIHRLTHKGAHSFVYTASNLEVEFCEAVKSCYQKYDEDKHDGEHVCDEWDEYYYQKD